MLQMNYSYYLTQGINVIAVNDKKQAIFPWKPYQSKQITEAEVQAQVSHPNAKGLAVVCGSVSGGLEVIDFDLKYATWDVYKAVKELIPFSIYKKIHIVRTKSHGYHWYYRCEVIDGNQKLASRLPTPVEAKSNPHIKNYCIIETRGEGGYVVAPPTEGYSIEQDGINVITSDERDALMEVLRSFNEVVEEVHIEAHNRPDAKVFSVSPFDDFNKRGDVSDILLKHGWTIVRHTAEKVYYLRPGGTSVHSGDYHYELGLFTVFSTNTPFTPQKGYKPAAVYAILEHNGDFKAAARALINEGYGERRDVSQQKKTDDTDIIGTFWHKTPRGALEINRYKLQVFLTEVGGFRLYFYDKGSTIFRLVRLKDGFVEEASTEQIKKFIKDYIDSLPDVFDEDVTPQQLLELIYKGAGIYFSDAFFEFLQRADIEFLRDTKDASYFPFLNGVVEVTRNTCRLKSYGELGRYVWKSQVIDHHIYVDQEGTDPESVEYFRFIKNVSGGFPEKYMYAISLIGYLLHQFKDPARPFAVILAEETDNEEKGGGTGKGIFVKALSHIVKVVRVDGKNFKIDKNFAFQRVDLDTRIVAIEDTRKKVDFEGFYSIITEGITVEKKNKDELFIPYKDSPKILFTTNYSISQNGVHAKRRQRVFEFAPYYGISRTPEDEFGHKLFEDWDKDEWNRFYNFMFFCVQDYLTNGVMDMPFSDAMAKKALRNQWGDEFAEFFADICDNTQWVNVENYHQQFLNMFDIDKKDFSRIRFSKAVKSGSEIMKKGMEMSKHKVMEGKVAIRFVKNEEEILNLSQFAPH